jgi:hypothetical protein
MSGSRMAAHFAGGRLLKRKKKGRRLTNLNEDVLAAEKVPNILSFRFPFKTRIIDLI